MPTPVYRLEKLAERLGLTSLYLKQDGLTARPFGGNKVRKLEFLLGEALAQGVKEVLTFGFAGSNHAVATAIFAREAGLKSISMLTHQPNAHYVQRNLLLELYAGAEIHCYPQLRAMLRGARCQKVRHFLRTGQKPLEIPPGGSSPTGVTGYVNAAFEWKQQLEQNNIPPPDVIYLAAGTAGTTVGLLIGFKALGIKTRLLPVQVVNRDWLSTQVVMELFNRSLSFLRKKSSDFPAVTLSGPEVGIRDEFLGKGYAHFSEAGMEAVRLMKETEGIDLDGTYTGKALAALVHDAREGLLKNKSVVFWNTLNQQDVASVIEGIDYRHLPKPLHRYFEKEVQPLDSL